MVPSGCSALLLAGSKSQLPAPLSKSSQKYKPVSGQRQIATESADELEENCWEESFDELAIEELLELEISDTAELIKEEVLELALLELDESLSDPPQAISALLISSTAKRFLFILYISLLLNFYRLSHRVSTSISVYLIDLIGA